MWQRNLSMRLAGPTIVVSFLLLLLCGVAAFYLYNEQAASASVHRETVSGADVGNELRKMLVELIAQLQAGGQTPEAIHQQIHAQLARARRLADTEEEKALEEKLEKSFAPYFALYREERTPDGHLRQEVVPQALFILEEKALPACRELQYVNVVQVRQTETALRRTLQWVIACLVGVCSLAALAGLLLGYGVARGVRQSIHHLSIHIHDAATKLGQDFRPIEVSEDGDLKGLHGQMEQVVREIEQVVDKLQQREREVLRAEQLAVVGQLAAGVAHELRNPLTSIKMLVQAGREGTSPDGLPGEDLEVIEREVRRMERCLQNFLDFARPPHPACRLLDVTRPVAHTAALIGGRARKQNVTVRFTPPPTAVPVQADEEQLAQLFINLALNALDVMPRGGTLDLEVRSPAGPTDRGQVEVRVQDTGPGIPPELLPRLFQPFVSAKETGLGLGLVTSRRIAETHGGTLQARNRPEGGACFILRLPTAAPTREEGGAA